MLSSGVVSHFPLWINDGSFSHLDDAVASREANLPGCVDEIHMRPLVLVIVDVVSELAKQDALRLQNSVSFFDKCRVKVRETIPVLL
jgi:hypothetical protein